MSLAPNSLCGGFLVTAAITLTTPLAAQTVVLDEDFRSCVVPPAGWTEVNNGITAGWEDDICEFAFHEYGFGAIDNQLITPSLDFSTLSAVWLHAVEVQEFAIDTRRNAIEISVDGGATWADVWVSTQTVDGTYAIEVDLSAYAGLSGVQLAFDYEGDNGNRWRIDQVRIDDQPFVPPLHWPNLPTSFVSADGLFETFDTLGGTVPPHMATNSVDAAWRSHDPLGYCNLGQQGVCVNPASGQYCLEMGLDPNTTLYHEVSNALVIGLNGAGVTNFTMHFKAKHYGEELQADDGVFLSDNGVDWIPVLSDWVSLIGGSTGVWVELSCDLSSTTVDVSGDFYLAFAQSDDYPYAFLDGVGIDDIDIGGAPPLLFDVQNLVAGQMADISVTGADPTSLLVLGYSLRGPGPTNTIYGVADLSSPIEQIGRYTPDALGELSIQVPIPPTVAGVPVWLQALEITVLDVGIWSNSLALTVQ